MRALTIALCLLATPALADVAGVVSRQKIKARNTAAPGGLPGARASVPRRKNHGN